jgi:hypothetical protein
VELTEAETSRDKQQKKNKWVSAARTENSRGFKSSKVNDKKK